MEQITVWIKQIVAVIIIAGFLEMILPDNRLKGVTRLVMGLLVITMMIQPVIALYHLPANYPEPSDRTLASLANGPGTETLIQDGIKLRGKWNEVLRSESEAAASHKIVKVLQAGGYSRPEAVEFEYSEGRVKKLILTLSLPKGNPNSLNQAEKEVIHLVSAITDLNEKLIEVTWRGRR